MIRFLIIMLALFSLAGCTTTPTETGMSGQLAPVVDGQTNTVTTGTLSDYQPVERPVGPGSGADAGQTFSSSQGSYAGVSSNVFTDTSNPLSIRSIYFGFNEYTVSEEYRQYVAAHAKFLIENPEARMLIQGNTDARGTREYNLVLGQKRADSVRSMLMMYGAREEQIESVSLGKENLYATGSTEQAHEQNRRADMLYRYQDRQEF